MIERKLGQGGMGAVYLVRHPQVPGRTFALKVLAGGALQDDSVARFRREMQALAAVSGHPNIVKVHGGRVDGPAPYFVMELVHGVALTHLGKGKALAPERAARLVRQVADAIAHAHAQGVLHRDLKPDNVMVEESDRPRVCDFGLATLAGEERLTQSMASMGTAAYSAPEQLDGRAKHADARADVYALGGILWFALVGRAPFEGSGVQLLKQVLMDAAPAPSSSAEGIPLALELICLHALEKDPEERYPTVAALRDDLDRFLAGGPVSVKPFTRGEKVRRWARHHRRRALALAGVLLALLTLVPGGLVLADRSRRAAVARALSDARRPDVTFGELEADAATVHYKGADPSQLAELRVELQRVVHRDAGLATSDEALRRAVAALEREGPLEPAEHRTLWTAQLDARAARLKAKGRAQDPAEVRALLATARAEKLPLDFAGELGTPFPLGDALVDAGCFDEAGQLVTEALAARPDAPAARFLRARARLARDRAPSAPLGAGRLDAASVRDPATLEDLAAAAGADGPPRARAAWLLAELLAAAGSKDAGAAADRALALEAIPGREHLKSVLSGPVTDEAYAALMERYRAGSLSLQALALFLARAGLTRAFEDPVLAELVAGGKDAPTSLETDAAADARRYVPILGHDPDDPTGATWTGARPKNWDALTREEQLRACPHDAALLDWFATNPGGQQATGLGIFFGVLASREDLQGVAKLASGVLGDRFMGTTPGQGTVNFRETLEQGAADSPLVETLRKALSPATVERAIRAATGLRGVSELDDFSELPKQDLAVRDCLVFRTLLDLDALEKLGGPIVLPYRARLRRHAFPGKLGAWLARIDLERLLWLATHAGELHLEPAETLSAGWGIVSWSALLCVGSVVAGCPTTSGPSEPGDWLERAGPRLLDLATQWIREDAIAGAALAFHGDDTQTEALRVIERDAYGVSRGWGLGSRAASRAKKLRGGTDVPDLLERDAIMARATPPDLAERLRRDTYKFVAPRLDPP